MKTGERPVCPHIFIFVPIFLCQQVGVLTAPFVKQVDCGAEALYPWLPGSKPDCLFSITESALHAGGGQVDATGKGYEEAADAVKAGYRLGQGKGKMQRAIAILRKRGKNVERLGKAMHLASKAMLGYESVENYIECKAQK